MMIENYYKILSLPANVERYKVACRYKHLSVKYFKTRRNQTDDDIYQINRAFEILRNEDLRKYYDFLYKKCYLDSNSKDASLTNEKYSKIIENAILKRNERTDRLINCKDDTLRQNIHNPILLSFLVAIFRLYLPSGYGIGWGPQNGLLFLIVGAIFLLRLVQSIDIASLVGGTFLFLFGFLLLYNNFRHFMIDLMNEEDY